MVWDVVVLCYTSHQTGGGVVYLCGGRFICVAVIQIARDPDGGCAQDQGYVVALGAETASGLFVIAHVLSTSEAKYCHLLGA